MVIALKSAVEILKSNKCGDLFERNIDSIKAEYRALAKLYHPDINKSSEAQEVFAKVNLLYDRANVVALLSGINEVSQDNIEICYVARSYFDKPLFIKNIAKDLGYLDGLNNEPTISISITHLDQTDDKVLLGKDNDVEIDDFFSDLSPLAFNNFYISKGELRENKSKLNFFV